MLNILFSQTQVLESKLRYITAIKVAKSCPPFIMATNESYSVEKII